MSKINSTSELKKHLRKDNMNVGEIAGQVTETAAKQSNINLLRRVTLANLLWENNTYVDGESVANEIARLIPLCDPEDVAKLALDCREKQKLRHTPLFIASEMCKYPEHKKYVDILLSRIITRADMLTDFLAIYWKDGKCPICNKVKKGLAEAFFNFNEYQFAKYDRKAHIMLRDVMFMVRPKPENEWREKLFNKIANRTLETPETWEVLLSKCKTDEEKCEVWVKLITENKIGGKAMLMNLNNMKKVNVPRPIISQGIQNLHSSMLLPLDYLKAVKYASEFKKEIENVMLKSYENLPKLPGKTLFIVDVSGSMDASISSGSRFSRLDCARAIAMLAINQCEDFELVCTSGNDGSREEAHKFIAYPSKGFDIFTQIDNYEIGWGGIFTYQCLEKLRNEVKDINSYERIIVFSDSQDIDVSYGENLKPRPFGKHNYICDVSAHKNGIAYDGVWDAEISGWSEHFLTYIAAYEGLENKFNE